MSAPAKPVLWHIPVSHFSEKVRWALAHKGVEHTRHTAPPGVHMAVAMWLTKSGHNTFPVLALDGRAIADSSAIIAALEQRYPERPLHPADPGALEHALELQRFFDAELGPHIRLLAWHELIGEHERITDLVAPLLPRPLRGFRPAASAAGRFAMAYTKVRYRVAPAEAASAAREKVLAALDRLDAELEAGGGTYLAGDSFSVADLTAASLFYPLVIPPEGPQQAEAPPGFERFRDSVRERPGYRWVAETYARDRRRT